MDILVGDVAVDDRGKVTFVNDFDFKDVKRFYMVENHQQGFVRAWHGHKKEGKYVLVVQGAAIVATVPFEGFNKDVERFVLSADKPKVLYIPPSHFNGFKTLSLNTKVMFFSTSTLEESTDDDYREDAQRWSGSGVWEVKER